MSNRPDSYQLADQLARLEAACAYVQAAVEILNDAQSYEQRSANLMTSYIKAGVMSMRQQLQNAHRTCQSLMGDMSIDRSQFPLQLVEDLDDPWFFTSTEE